MEETASWSNPVAVIQPKTQTALANDSTKPLQRWLGKKRKLDQGNFTKIHFNMGEYRKENQQICRKKKSDKVAEESHLAQCLLQQH